MTYLFQCITDGYVRMDLEFPVCKNIFINCRHSTYRPASGQVFPYFAFYFSLYLIYTY